MKHTPNKMYLLNTDIETLNERYEILYKKVKDNPHLTKEQINREAEVLLAKYNFELEELNALREVEYKTQQAKIKARNKREIPINRCWLWLLLLQPLTNRAQNIIEKEAALNAEKRFSPIEQELLQKAAQLYNLDINKLSQHKRKKLLKKYLKNKSVQKAALQVHSKLGAPSEATTAAHEERDAAHQSGADAQKAAAEQLEDIIQAADNVAPGEAFEQPEPPATVQTPEDPKPKRKRKKKEPLLTSEAKTELKKALKKIFDDSTNATAELAPMAAPTPTIPGQLPGQIGIEDLSADK